MQVGFREVEAGAAAAYHACQELHDLLLFHFSDKAFLPLHLVGCILPLDRVMHECLDTRPDTL